MVGEHFTSNGYAHAASLSGYLGPDTPRYTPHQLVALGLTHSQVIAMGLGS